jgi:hypothetical protein
MTRYHLAAPCLRWLRGGSGHSCGGDDDGTGGVDRQCAATATGGSGGTFAGSAVRVAPRERRQQDAGVKDAGAPHPLRETSVTEQHDCAASRRRGAALISQQRKLHRQQPGAYNTTTGNCVQCIDDTTCTTGTNLHYNTMTNVCRCTGWIRTVPRTVCQTPVPAAPLRHQLHFGRRLRIQHNKACNTTTMRCVECIQPALHHFGGLPRPTT